MWYSLSIVARSRIPRDCKSPLVLLVNHTSFLINTQTPASLANAVIVFARGFIYGSGPIMSMNLASEGTKIRSAHPVTVWLGLARGIWD